MSEPKHWACGRLFVTSPVQPSGVIISGPHDPWLMDSAKVRCLYIGGEDRMTAAFLPEQPAGESLSEFANSVMSAVERGEGRNTTLANVKDISGWFSGGDRNPSSVRRYAREQEGVTDDSKAIALAQTHLHAAIEMTLDEYLAPELRAALITRPHLPLKTAATLLRFAKPQGTAALRYMGQALAIESLGLLHFAAQEIEQQNPVVADVIASGSSLSSVLNRVYNIPPWLHRATLNLAPLRTADTQGDLFLLLLMHTASVRQHSMTPTEANALVQLPAFVQRVCSNESPTRFPWAQLITVTLNCKVSTHEALTRYTAVFEEALCRLQTLESSAAPARTSLVSFILALPIDHANDCEVRLSLVAECVIHYSTTLRNLTTRALKHHPGVPDATSGAACFTPLMDISKIIAIGRKFENCLAAAPMAVEYVGRAIALYQIETNDGVQAVCALGSSSSAEEVVVLEVQAARTEKFTTPVTCAAWELALSCSRDIEIMAAFAQFDDAAGDLVAMLSVAGIRPMGTEIP